MSETIEQIWKKGFLDETQNVTPKVQDLYNRKSQNLVDNFERKYDINIKALFIGTPVCWLFLNFSGLPILANFIAIGFIVHAVIGYRHFQKLKSIEKTESSYDFLTAFKNWLTCNMKEMTQMSCVFYPSLALMFAVQFRQTGPIQELLDLWVRNHPEGFILLDSPGWYVVGTGVICTLLFFLAPAIFRFDMNSIYKKDITRLDDMLADMEELRK